MKELTLIVAKGDVYDEVALTTSYTGSKMGGDPDAYERIYTTTADQAQLNRFWTESRVAVCEALRKFLDDVEEDETGLRIVLSLPSSFDDSLGGGHAGGDAEFLRDEHHGEMVRLHE